MSATTLKAVIVMVGLGTSASLYALPGQSDGNNATSGSLKLSNTSDARDESLNFFVTEAESPRLEEKSTIILLASERAI